MSRVGWLTKTCLAVGFCAVTAILSHGQTFATLVSFNGADGFLPQAAPVQGTDGNLYGVTSEGGGTTACSDGCGTVYKVTPTGDLTTLYRFCPNQNCTDGLIPAAGLTLGADGNFYGVAGGGSLSFGIVFKITPDGELSVVHNFAGYPADGTDPSATLILATDGNFYGTTRYGGSSLACSGGCGSVFKMTPEGAVTILHSFDGTDGSFPITGVTQAADGSLYGVTANGGASNACLRGCGTIFKITSLGNMLTTLHSFDGNDGASPYGALVQASDGSFYGTAFDGALDSSLCDTGIDDLSCGTVFTVTSGGTFMTVHRFDGTDGAHPVGVVLATDGNFYGATYAGGNGSGTVFKMTSEGTVSTIHSLGNDAGVNPLGIAQATNGAFYGVTLFGGPYTCSFATCGTIFSESVGLSPFVTLLPSSRAVGQRVAILGNNLTGATSVTFNGTPATFTVVSSTEISTTVPSGATTGTVQVVTPSGTLSSNVNFRVLP